MNILENYLDNIQLDKNSQYLSEDFQSIIDKLKTMNIKKIIDLLNDSVKTKNLSKIKSVFNMIKIPTISMDQIKSRFKKKIPGFEKSYLLSQKVIKNSVPKLSDKAIDVLATVIAAKSNHESNKPMDDTKENITTAVRQVRKYIGEGTNYDGGNLGAVIFIVYIIGSLVAGAITAISIPTLLLVGGFLLACKTIFE